MQVQVVGRVCLKVVWYDSPICGCLAAICSGMAPLVNNWGNDMRQILLAAAAAGMLLAATESALAAVTVQGKYAIQLNKTCPMVYGPSIAAEYGQATFTLNTKSLSITGFADTITPNQYGDNSAIETNISTTEPYGVTPTTLTLGLFVYHANFESVVKGVAKMVVFGDLDPAGCIESGTLIQ